MRGWRLSTRRRRRAHVPRGTAAVLAAAAAATRCQVQFGVYFFAGNVAAAAAITARASWKLWLMSGMQVDIACAMSLLFLEFEL